MGHQWDSGARLSESRDSFHVVLTVNSYHNNNFDFDACFKVTLVLEAFDLHDEKFQWKQEQEIVLPPNCSTDFLMTPLPGQPTLTKRSEVPRIIILSARLVDRKGAVISRNANW